MNLEVCFKAWEYQNLTGYVYLSAKNYTGEVDKHNKPLGVWTDKRFKYPSELRSIKIWANKQVKDNARVDLYWCPNIFTSMTRKEGNNGENISSCRVMYADLDFVSPDEIEYRPSVAWQSSPDRYQCLWFLDDTLPSMEFVELNKAMTYLTGADKSGWDLTQVLRIPGLDNHKTEIATPGKLLWAKYDRTYDNTKFNFEDAPAMTMDLKLTGNFFELITKHKNKLEEAKILHRLQWTSERIKGCDRSDALWAMTREMLKVNIPMDDIASIVQQSAWNKYSNRSPGEEKKRIINDINKAHKSLIEKKEPTKRQQEAIEDVTTTEEDEILKEAKKMIGSFKSYDQVMMSNKIRPNWLIDKIWVDKAQGIIAGEAKTFKSTITTDIAMSVASGAPLWGKYKVNHTGPVIIVQVENNEDLVKDRMARMGHSKGVNGEIDIEDNRTLNTTFGKSLPIYTHIPDKNHASIKFSNPAHLLAVEMLVKEIKPVLVIFDPLYQLFDGDMSNSQELAPALRWLKELRINYDTAVMLVHHYNKGSGEKGKTSAGHRLLGSVTLHGWVECMLALEKGPTSNNITQLVMNKEFRAMGSSDPLFLSIKMGDSLDDYTYEVKVKENNEMDAIEDNALALIDIVSEYEPDGIRKDDLCSRLNLSEPQLVRLMTKSKCIKVVGKGIKAKVRLALPGRN